MPSLYSREIRVGKIIFDKKEVFEKKDPDWFFAAPFLNNLHTTTNDYIIRDELLFTEGDYINEELIFETERNLRRTALFTDAYIELDSISYDMYDVYVNTKDRWSLFPSILFGTGGGVTNYGGRIQEFNLAGTGTSITLEALHRGENNIGWQGSALLEKSRLFRTEVTFLGSIMANKLKTAQALELVKPYRTLNTLFSYGIKGFNSFGNDFVYNELDSFKLAPFHSKILTAYFSRSWKQVDRIFVTGYLEVDDVKRPDSLTRQMNDNSGEFLLMFSSVKQKFHEITKINYYYPEDMVVGGYGSATLGKIFSLGSDGDDGYYLGAQGEISYYDGKNYLFGQLTAGSSFNNNSALYTYQEFLGSGFTNLIDGLVLTGRFRQQTVWNWDAFHQLILDNDIGLRGYDANRFAGQNRIISNMELRYFPNIPIWIFNLSTVAFWDIGTVWNQDQKLYDSKFYNAAGLGLRFHFSKSSSPSHTLRIDLAYNFYDNKIGGIILSTKQMFSAFGNHEFKLPQIFGKSIDLE